MKYKVGHKVKVIATHEELKKICVKMKFSIEGTDIYENKKKIFIIKDIDFSKNFGGITCPYQVGDNEGLAGAYFPGEYLKPMDREQKFKRILKNA